MLNASLGSWVKLVGGICCEIANGSCKFVDLYVHFYDVWNSKRGCIECVFNSWCDDHIKHLDFFVGVRPVIVVVSSFVYDFYRGGFFSDSPLKRQRLV